MSASPSLLLLPLLLVAAPAQQVTPAVIPTWTEHIAPLVFGHCTSCHRPGEAAPFPLQSYRDVQKRAKNLLQVMTDRTMPLWHPEPGYGEFRDELRLADDDIARFRAWVEAGKPEGPPAALPPLPEFPVGWQLGEPDLVVTMPAGFPVPAGGPDIYRSFVIPLDLPEDRWISAIEVRPSARAVLHHIVFGLDSSREARELDGQDGAPGFAGMRALGRSLRNGAGEGLGSGSFGGWAVGGMAQHLPEGLAPRLPRGADLILNSHFHPSGKPEVERTTLGIHFAPRPPTRSLHSIQLPPFFGIGAGLDIPANDSDWVLQDSFELPCDVDAVSVGGHAHMLCSSMRMYAELPNGGRVPLLHIPAWDFDWQNRYTYRQLVRLPRGARLHAEIHYDNSSSNAQNPFDPPRRVRWGRESTDEMGSITLLVTPADENDTAVLQRAVRQHRPNRQGQLLAEQFDRRFAALDRDGDRHLSRDEVPPALRSHFGPLDGDGDGRLSLDEARGVLQRLRGRDR